MALFCYIDVDDEIFEQWLQGPCSILRVHETIFPARDMVDIENSEPQSLLLVWT